jgi:hypothetical protein
MRWNGLLPITIAALLAGASPAAADTFTVTGTQDTGVGVGCETSACPSIRAAIVSAAGTPVVDTILVPAGEYQLSANSGELYIDTPVEIVGAGARDTIVYGDRESYRVMEVAPGWSASVSGMTLRDGVANFDPSGFQPGGVLRNSGTLALDRVRITNGRASSGGGLANTGGTLTVTRSLIDHNAADIGGADAGGILNFGSGTLTVRDSTIAANSASLAGAFLSWGAGATPNSTTFEHVTVAGNTASGRGIGGLGHDAADTLRLRASIVAGNTFNGEPSNCGSPVTSDGANIETEADCGLTGSGDLEQTDPQFAAPGLVTDGGQTDVLALAPTSPAVDVDPGCTGFDQRDVSRPQGAACDAGAFEVDQAPETGLEGAAPPFTFASNEPGSRFECAVDGGPFAACVSPWTPAGLAPGTHTLAVRAVDSAGTADASPTTRSFTVAATPLPSQPTPTPVPTPTPTPAPVAGKSVGAEPLSGKVLVKLPGSKKFVELEPSVIPNGAEVDTRKGIVEITRSDGQVAKFYSGIFKLSQSGGITTLTLAEKLTGCKSSKKKASAAAKKPKTRKLWGDGKGKFRTRGQYSAATVRGTKWLVTDTCTSTVTKVSQGVVKVRDEVKKKTIILRKRKSYTARAKR